MSLKIIRLNATSRISFVLFVNALHDMKFCTFGALTMETI